MEKNKENTTKIQCAARHGNRKKMGSGQKKPPDIGDETQKTEKNTVIFSLKTGWKTVVYGTGRNNEIRPGTLSWMQWKNVGKSRVTAKNI